MSEALTDGEMRALRVLVDCAAKACREDAVGAILYTGAFRYLSDGDDSVCALAQKLERYALGEGFYANGPLAREAQLEKGEADYLKRLESNLSGSPVYELGLDPNGKVQHVMHKLFNSTAAADAYLPPNHRLAQWKAPAYCGSVAYTHIEVTFSSLHTPGRTIPICLDCLRAAAKFGAQTEDGKDACV